jgi:pimeloyl-ACP methyl ester carboxylesterase
VLPVRYTHPTHTIPKEGHMLVMTSPQVVNEFLAKALQESALKA